MAVWIGEASGQKSNAPAIATTEVFSRQPVSAAVQRRLDPAVIVGIVVAASLGAFVARSNAANDVKATLQQWANTWNITGAQARVDARNHVTCAKHQLVLQP
jgi:hypothetical protein